MENNKSSPYSSFYQDSEKQNSNKAEPISQYNYAYYDKTIKENNSELLNKNLYNINFLVK